MKTAKISFLLPIFLLLLVLLTSCGTRIKADEAKERADAFVAAIAEERYDDAAALMHPSRETAGDDLKMYFTSMTEEYDVDFKNAFQVDRYHGFRSSLYDSKYEGSYYSLTGTASADGQSFELTVELVRNDYGYGIHNIHFDFGK